MKKKLAPGGSYVGGPGMTPGDVAKRKMTGAAATKKEVQKVLRKTTGAAATKAEKKRMK